MSSLTKNTTFSPLFQLYFTNRLKPIRSTLHLNKKATLGYILTYFGPLCFVLTITISKEALDDYQRYKRDKEANSQLYKRLTPTGIQSIPSSKIRVGDLLYIMKDQRIPADMVLLRTTEETGASFIRTDQLDGETDWKLRLAVPSLQRLSSDQDLMNIRGQLYGKKRKRGSL
ncbi:hypothetical protein CU098_002803, partial [Rhizopus stolonifer]